MVDYCSTSTKVEEIGGQRTRHEIVERATGPVTYSLCGPLTFEKRLRSVVCIRGMTLDSLLDSLYSREFLQVSPFLGGSMQISSFVC